MILKLNFPTLSRLSSHPSLEEALSEMCEDLGLQWPGSLDGLDNQVKSLYGTMITW